MQAQADRMAERLRQGLRDIINQQEVAACVYGEASTFHVYFGARSIAGYDANTLKNVPAAVQNGFRQAVQVRGVDLMSRCSGVLSGVHTEADIDKSLEAFDGALHAMLTEGLVQHG
jgi:glutamate-1-semialdehyde 2,1-aminomutase